MRIGYQGEAHSYSYRAVGELFVDGDVRGFRSFVEVFDALRQGDVERIVVPVENSTTGSVLPVLDRLPADSGVEPVTIIGEHLVEVRHSLLASPGAELSTLRSVRSHPQALAQAEASLLAMGIEPVAAFDTAGAVAEVAAAGDLTVAALAPPEAAEPHGLVVVQSDVMDRPHNTTRFLVLRLGEPDIAPDHDKTTVVFTTAHRPGALALALTEFGLRGANLTRIESRPADERWTYRFFVDFLHDPGPEGLSRVLEPSPASLGHLQVLGSYRSGAATG